MSEQPIKLFISHASEDKQPFVEQLYTALKARPQFDVWYDTDSLHLGDSLTFEISDGLKNCDYALVVLSPTYITKKWCKLEFASMIALETSERKIILPIWHDNITEQQVKDFTPLLADRVAIHSTRPIDDIVLAIETATWTGQKARELAAPYLELVVEVQNEILHRKINDQLSTSFDGVKLVKENVFYIWDRFEQLLKELPDSFHIQIQRRDALTFYPGIIASGPYNTNVEIGFGNNSANRTVDAMLVISMFAWDYERFPAEQGKRKERGHVIYNPSFTTNREVVWTMQDDTTKRRWITDQIAQQAVTSLLQFIKERAQAPRQS